MYLLLFNRIISVSSNQNSLLLSLFVALKYCREDISGQFADCLLQILEQFLRIVILMIKPQYLYNKSQYLYNKSKYLYHKNISCYVKEH